MGQDTPRDALGRAYSAANHLIRNFQYFNRETRRAHLRLFIVQWTWILSAFILVLLDTREPDPVSESFGIPGRTFGVSIAPWDRPEYFIIALLTLGTAFFSAIQFYCQLYDIRDHKSAAVHWMTLVFGLGYVPGWFFARSLAVGTLLAHMLGKLRGYDGYGYLVISQGRIRKEDSEDPVVKAGGPAFLIVHSDSTVLLEQDGAFTQVRGPGFVFLEPFERVREAVDLRPQVRVDDSVHAMTKDGIPICVRLELEFMIQPAPRPARHKPESNPYPYFPRAVRRAVYNKTVVRIRDEGQIYDWKDLVMCRARFALQDLLNTYTFDRLIEPEDADPHRPLDGKDTPYRKIQIELRRRLSTRTETAPNEEGATLYLDAKDIGVTVTRATLGHLRIDSEYKAARDAITENRIKSWQAEWMKRRAVILARGEAENERLKETARAEAEENVLRAIAHGLETTNATSDENISHVLALRMIDALERTTLDPRSRAFIPEQTLEILSKLREVYLH